MKLGSFVKEEAICSTKNCRTSGESVLAGFALLVSLPDLGFVKSRVMLGPDEDKEFVEQGTEPSAMQRFEPDVASIEDGWGWLCSPS